MHSRMQLGKHVDCVIKTCEAYINWTDMNKYDKHLCQFKSKLTN